MNLTRLLTVNSPSIADSAATRKPNTPHELFGGNFARVSGPARKTDPAQYCSTPLEISGNTEPVLGTNERHTKKPDRISATALLQRSVVDDFSTRKRRMSGVGLSLADSAKASVKDKLSSVERALTAPEPVPASQPATNADGTVKRKRGRPKKHEQVAKERTVTRKSLRIGDKPAAGPASKAVSALVTLPKPLSVLNFDQLLSPVESTSHNPGGSLDSAGSEKSNNAPLRLHQIAQVNTLSVLLQYVKEHSPRSRLNDTVNEELVLLEFKHNLFRLLEDLVQQHGAIHQLNRRLLEIQRTKNELRKQITDIRTRRSETASEIEQARQEHRAVEKKHRSLLEIVHSIENLKDLVNTGPANNARSETDLSRTVDLQLESFARLFDPEWGLQRRLKAVNAKLASMLQGKENR